MIYEKPEIKFFGLDDEDVIRTSLIPGGGGGPDISAPGADLYPGGGGGPEISPLGGSWL